MMLVQKHVNLSRKGENPFFRDNNFRPHRGHFKGTLQESFIPELRKANFLPS